MDTDLFEMLTDYAIELASISDLDDLCSFVAKRAISLVNADECGVYFETRPLIPENTRSTLAIPLRLKDEELGVLVAERYSPGRDPTLPSFSPADEQRLTLLAHMCAVAAANIIRRETVQLRANWRDRALDIMQELGRAMGSTLELRPLMRRISDATMNALNAECGMLALLDRDGQLVLRAVAGEIPRELVGQPLDAQTSLLGWAIKRGGPVLTGPGAAWGQPYTQIEFVPRTQLATPLVTKGRTIGAIELAHTQDGAFDPEDLHLLEALAVPAAAAIENARIYERVQRQAVQQENIIRVGRALSSAADAEAVLQEVVESALWAIPVAVTATIHLLDRDAGLLRLHCYAGHPEWEKLEKPFAIGEGVAGHVFASGQMVNVADVVTDPRFVPGPGHAVYRSMLVAPLVVEARRLGTLSINALEPNGFGRDDELMLRALASQAAVVLRNARLLDSLRDSETRLRRLVENANALLITADQQGNITFAGGRWVEMLGYQPDQIVGLSYRHLCHPEDWPTLAKHINRVLKIPSRITDLRYRTWHIDGNIRWHQVSAVSTGGPDGQVDRLHAVIHDVTDQVAAEQAIARHADQLAALNTIAASISRSLDVEDIVQAGLTRLLDALDMDVAGLARIDSEQEGPTHQMQVGTTSEFLKVVQAFARVEAALQTGSPQPIVIPDMRDAHFDQYPALKDAALQEGVHTLAVVPIVVKEWASGVMFVGSRTPGAVSPAGLELLVTIAQQFGVALHNAWLFAQAEERATELELVNRQLQDLARRKSQFVQNTSHELRTPLSFIRGYLEMLKDGELGPLSTEQQHAVELLFAKGELLVELVNDITSLLEIELEPNDIETVNLTDVVARSANALKYRSLEAGVVIDIEWPSEPPLVKGHYRGIAQVLTHLLENAIKFSPNGGHVRVRIWTEQDKAFVQVSDRGIGISPEEQESIFDRFYQVDGSTTRRFGGTGLGLAIVKETVEAYGGTVRVESSGVEGEGTTFTVALPLMSKDDVLKQQ